MNKGQQIFQQEVLPLFELNRAEWLAQARKVALQLGLQGPTTINNVRAVCPPPKDVDPRVMGAVFTSKHWIRTGFESSSRAHGRPIGIFLLSDAGRAAAIESTKGESTP